MQPCFLPDVGASLLIVRWNHFTMQLMPITEYGTAGVHGKLCGKALSKPLRPNAWRGDCKENSPRISCMMCIGKKQASSSSDWMGFYLRATECSGTPCCPCFSVGTLALLLTCLVGPCPSGGAHMRILATARLCVTSCSGDTLDLLIQARCKLVAKCGQSLLGFPPKQVATSGISPCPCPRQ